MDGKEYKVPDELNKLWEKVKLNQFPAPKGGKILEVKSDASIKDVANILISNNILSVPVVDAKAAPDASWLEKYTGLVDMIDIARFVLAQLEEKAHHHHARGYAGFAEDSKILAETPISSLVGKPDSTPFVPVEVTCSLREAMVLLGKYHLYRLPIIDGEKQQLVNLLTQSAIVKTIEVNIKKLGAVVDLPLGEVGLANPKKMISVSVEAPAISAFQLITANRVGAVPVLGLGGEVVGNISARDLRAVFTSPDLYAALFRPLSQFIALVHGDQIDASAPAITCRASHSLRHVIQQLTTSRIHRVYVVDDKSKLVSVVSLTDVISALVTEPEAPMSS